MIYIDIERYNFSVTHAFSHDYITTEPQSYMFDTDEQKYYQTYRDRFCSNKSQCLIPRLQVVSKPQSNSKRNKHKVCRLFPSHHRTPFHQNFLTFSHPVLTGHSAQRRRLQTDPIKPGDAPIASDSCATNFGTDNGTNQPVKKGIKGVSVDSQPSSKNADTKST
jgi:hypothetical protein